MQDGFEGLRLSEHSVLQISEEASLPQTPTGSKVTLKQTKDFFQKGKDDVVPKGIKVRKVKKTFKGKKTQHLYLEIFIPNSHFQNSLFLSPLRV